jgi:hypothetical protein
MTITKARIDMNIPKKRPGVLQHSKARLPDSTKMCIVVLRHIDFAKVKKSRLDRITRALSRMTFINTCWQSRSDATIELY